MGLVSGAASGIGRATAIRLGRRGYAVVCLDVNRRGAEVTASLLETALAVEADVTNEDSVQDAVCETVKAFGSLDAVVASAGIGGGEDSLHLDVGQFRRMLETNVIGSALVACTAARLMVDQRIEGSIVLLGSTSSKVASAARIAYCASKGAVLMLGRALAVDLADHSIRVNVVGPGPTLTPMTESTIHDPTQWDTLKARIPQARPGEPDEIAAVIEFLISEDASYVTGAFIPVDGGLLAR